MLVKHHNYSHNFDDTVRFFYLYICSIGAKRPKVSAEL